MTSTQVTEFEALRPHLMSVAYRLTGTVADAEDIVQEAWLRWNSAGARGPIADLRAWLTTVVSRLGLDRLRSAAHRRETYTGNWLPEPVVTGYGFQGADPLCCRGGTRGCPVRGDGCAGTSFARPTGCVRAARRIRRAVRRSGAGARNQRDRRPAAGLAGPQGRHRFAATGTRPVAQRGGRQTDGRDGRRRPGRRGGAVASRRDVHRRFGWQGAHGSSGHPWRGQGRSVHARSRPTLWPVDVYRV